MPRCASPTVLAHQAQVYLCFDRFLAGYRRQIFDCSLDDRSKRNRLTRQKEFVRGYSRIFEKLVDKALLGLRIAFDHYRPGNDCVIAHLLTEQFNPTKDRRNRRSEFMRDNCEKIITILNQFWDLVSNASAMVRPPLLA